MPHQEKIVKGEQDLPPKKIVKKDQIQKREKQILRQQYFKPNDRK
jgi:hypothetical protein